jgi:hypothetical protein
VHAASIMEASSSLFIVLLACDVEENIMTAIKTACVICFF